MSQRSSRFLNRLFSAFISTTQDLIEEPIDQNNRRIGFPVES